MEDGINLALKAYENKNYNEAYDYFTKVKEDYSDIIEKNYLFKYIKCIYLAKLKNMTELSEENQSLVVYSLEKLKSQDLFQHLIIFKVVGILEKKYPYPSDKIITWLKKLDPQYLSSERNEYKIGNGKNIVNQSHKEKYYSLLSKAYEKKGDMKKSYQVSIEALKVLTEFTNDSSVWFLRRIAHYERAESNYEKTLKLLEEIKKQKKDWFILSEIGEIYLKLNKIDLAKKYYLEAALSPGDYTMMVNLFKDIATLYAEEDSTFFRDNIILYLKIRKEKKWEIKDKEFNFLKKLNIDIDKVKPSNKLYLKLKEDYQNKRWNTEEKYFGKIIQSFGKAGFIAEEKGRKYYFQIKDFKKKKDAFEIGEKVSFNIKEGFDKKRKQISFQAVNIIVED